MTTVREIEVTDSVHGPGVRATVDWESPGIAADELIYTYRSMPPGSISAPGDVVLAAVLFPAMRLGAPLIVDAPVSKRLLAGVRVIVDICSGWAPLLQHIPIEAPVVERSNQGGGGVGQLFSCGVDSFYSLLRQRADHDAVTTLVTIHGYDMKPADTEGFAFVRARAERVAAELGKELLFVETNLGEIGKKFISSAFLQGGLLASCVLGLGGVLRKCYEASTMAYRHLAPWGSHPFIDPLWSTESLELVHDGAELARHEKVYEIARTPLALETLRVCSYELENCRRCSTCLVTMLALDVAGALKDCPTLGPSLDLDVLEKWRVNYLFLDVLAELAADVTDPAVKRAVLRATHRATRRHRFAHPVAKFLRRTGLRPDTIELSPLWQRTDSQRQIRSGNRP
jgi:hypothetical protein